MRGGSLRARVALVTGAGRRRGIGTAICRALAEKGTDVFFTYWSAYDDEMFPDDGNRPEALLEELRGAGVRRRRWKGPVPARVPEPVAKHRHRSARADVGGVGLVATKGAMEAFTRTLAAEVGPKGITANAVNPGPTDTGWMGEDLKRQLSSQFPPGRVGRPEVAASLAAFLAGEQAAWITGQVIHAEGGFLRS